jgi:Fic family protein
LVQAHLTEFCEYINDNWHEKTAFYLSAYAMWRLNWIHPFSDGNGRTSRALSYALLGIKLGYLLPGSPTIPQQIEADNSHYIEALEAADAAAINGGEDISEMEAMIRSMLAKQLLGVIDAADRAHIPN